MKTKKKALVYLGTDKFNLNILDSLLLIILKEKKKIDFHFISPKPLKSKILKNLKTYKSFNQFRKKEKFQNFKILLNLWSSTIFTKNFLNNFEMNLNLHPSYLPYWRGKNSAYYANLNLKGNGATLHEMDDKIDNGKIFIRKGIKVDFEETGFETYKKSIKESIKLFKNNFSKIIRGKIKKNKIKSNTRVYLKNEFPNFKFVDLNKKRNKQIYNFLRNTLSLDFPENKMHVRFQKDFYEIKVDLKKIRK